MQIVTKLTLQNFRCFDIRQFEFGNITYIHGGNGTGKTAILEAVSLVNGQNSFRAKTMDGLIKNEDGIFEAMLETVHGNVFIQHDATKKILELGGDKVTANYLRGMFHPVLFSPQYELSLNTPSAIRSFIDKLSGYLFNEHDRLLSKCRELLSERIKILLMSGNSAWLASIEEQVSQVLSVIAYNRLMLVQKLNGFLEEVSQGSSIDIEDRYTDMLKERQKFSQLEKQITEDLLQSRNLDKAQGKNSISLSDTEYKMLFRGQKIEFCSSGQQKLMGTLMALGVGLFLKEMNRATIILLDDITAKIDSHNQGYLHEIIKQTECQTIISTIDAPLNSKGINFIEL